MTITYCEKCGTLMRLQKISEPKLCADCSSGKPVPKSRTPRHSDMIPRKNVKRAPRNK